MERARIGVAGVVIAALMLSACGGGGGGGTIPDGTAVQTTPFTKWDDSVAGKVIEAKGFGREIDYKYKCDPSNCRNTGQIIGVTDPARDTSVTARFFFDDSGKLTQFWPTSAIGFTGALPELAFNKNFVLGTSGTAQAIVSDPTNPAWYYQSFGVWESGLESETAGTYGVVSVGARTPASAIPTTQSAEFTGKVVGAYVDTSGKGYAVIGELDVHANFVDRTLFLATENTKISPGTQWKVTDTFVAPSVDLNFSGTLKYDSGTNRFEGSVETASGNLKGTSTGAFYGPGAEELGGVFSLDSSNPVETYAGAYGATRTTAP